MARAYHVRVELANGTVIDVETDQRDNAAAEAAGLVAHLQPVTWVRHCAWTALRRASKYHSGWQHFNEVGCIEAIDRTPPAEESADDDAPDPGRPGRTAG